MLEVENAPYFTLDIASAYCENDDEILHIIKIHDHIKGRFVAVVNVMGEPRKIVSSSGKITTSESIRCSENQIAANSSKSDKACAKYVKDYITDGGWTDIPSSKRCVVSHQNKRESTSLAIFLITLLFVITSLKIKLKRLTRALRRVLRGNVLVSAFPPSS